MASEESPLLGPSADDLIAEIQHDAVYERFSTLRKRYIVAIVSLAGLIPCKQLSIVLHLLHTPNCSPVFVSGSFIPAIPQIALDLNSTGAVIRYLWSTNDIHATY